MHLFTADEFTGQLRECDEGVLEWIAWKRMLELPHWKGDEIFLSLIEREDVPFFSLKLHYDANDTLLSAVLNGQSLEIGGGTL